MMFLLTFHIMLQLTDALLAIEEEKAIWSSTEKASVEAIENKSKSYDAEIVVLTDTLSKVRNELEACREECHIISEKLALAEEKEEVRRLSLKKACTFEVNEKAAMKAIDEANKLRAEKRVLEDTLVKVNKDLQYLGDCFQEKLVFLENQITLKSKQLENIKKQIENMTESQNLESERLKELATDSSENLFLLKEKDLQLEIEELEKKLDSLVQKSDNTQ